MTNKQNNKIWMSSPHMSGHEQKYINEAFATNWIAPLGPNVDGLELDICNYTGVKGAAALSSGTAAIHLALRLCGIKEGDFVICQSFTFVATANPIVYEKAIPVFVDSERETWGMDPLLLEKAIHECIQLGKKPAAIMPVHLYGMPCKIEAILEIANKYDIPVIEDAAEALGSTYRNMQCGSYGHFGILSFNGNKIITSSGGGMLLSSDIGKIEKARFFSTQSRDIAPYYAHSEIGYNYRMSNVLAGIGRGQMEVINDRVNQRRSNFDFYVSQLSQIPGITFLNEPEGVKSNRWLTTILVDPNLTGGVTSEDIRIALEKENIESRPLWKPMHLQPLFNGNVYIKGEKDVCKQLFDHGLCLPSGSNLTEEELTRVVNTIKNLIFSKEVC